MTHKKTRESEGLKGLIGSGPATSFWTAPNETSGPLTREALEKAMESFKKRADWQLANPHGTSNNPHLISLKAHRRGYGICVECGAPVGNWPDDKHRRPSDAR